MKPFAAVLAILALVLGLALVFRSGSGAHPTQAAMEADLVCVTCHEPLDESVSPLAQQMKKQISKQIAAGWSKKQIEHYFVVTEGFGKSVLATPTSNGFDLLAWLLPLGVIVLGAGAVGLGARAWLADRDGPGTVASLPTVPKLAPNLELRVDQELARFDS
ncbi:MAG TPA: cytochrome c-type biogenesis protein CcmH [Gaiellaceae bacterium]|nr:cytochrome c-type biogenesis protein CcmH [Gaiellaceae bacterium]